MKSMDVLIVEPEKSPRMANIYAHLDYNSKLSSAQAMIEGLNFVSAGQNEGE